MKGAHRGLFLEGRVVVVEAGWSVAFLLALARASGFVASAPVFSGRGLPLQVRAALAAGLSLFVAGKAKGIVPTGPEILLILGKEALVGLLMGYTVALAFHTVQIAGEVIDFQMGFGAINVLDPMTSTSISVMGQIHYTLATVAFLLIDGHHRLLVLLARSFDLLPLGAGSLGPGIVGPAVTFLTQTFALGLQLAAPVMVALFAVDVVLGILAKAVPQMNVFIVGLPLKIGVGTVLVAVVLPHFLAAVQGAYQAAFATAEVLLRRL